MPSISTRNLVPTNGSRRSSLMGGIRSERGYCTRSIPSLANSSSSTKTSLPRPSRSLGTYFTGQALSTLKRAQSRPVSSSTVICTTRRAEVISPAITLLSHAYRSSAPPSEQMMPRLSITSPNRARPGSFRTCVGSLPLRYSITSTEIAPIVTSLKAASGSPPISTRKRKLPRGSWRGISSLRVHHAGSSATMELAEKSRRNQSGRRRLQHEPLEAAVGIESAHVVHRDHAAVRKPAGALPAVQRAAAVPQRRRIRRRGPGVLQLLPQPSQIARRRGRHLPLRIRPPRIQARRGGARPSPTHAILMCPCMTVMNVQKFVYIPRLAVRGSGIRCPLLSTFVTGVDPGL